MNGESDESWNQFAPNYRAFGTRYMTSASALGTACLGLSESLRQYADYCVATEANNTQLGKSALNLKGEPGSAAAATSRTAGQGVAAQGLLISRKAYRVPDGESVRPVGRDFEGRLVEPDAPARQSQPQRPNET